MEQEAPDGVRRAAAVVEQLGEIGIALLGDVLGEGADQVAEEGQGQGVLAHDSRYIGEQRLGRGFTCRDALERLRVDA